MTYRRMLKSKIHRARVTQELLEAANILPYEAVNIWNVTAGTRFETYAIEGASGSCGICVNGAAAHLVTPGDIIIIASFVQLLETQCHTHLPIVVFVDEKNSLKEIRPEIVAL